LKSCAMTYSPGPAPPVICRGVGEHSDCISWWLVARLVGMRELGQQQHQQCSYYKLQIDMPTITDSALPTHAAGKTGRSVTPALHLAYVPMT
jgi:hypothetical protein